MASWPGGWRSSRTTTLTSGTGLADSTTMQTLCPSGHVRGRGVGSANMWKIITYQFPGWLLHKLRGHPTTVTVRPLIPSSSRGTSSEILSSPRFMPEWRPGND